MNWGTKLVIGMLCFMSFIVALGVLMFNSKDDALVDKNYYEKGLNYDQEYSLKEQVSTDQAAPLISLSPHEMIISFKAAAEGNLKLVRNSDQQMDRRIGIKTDKANQVKIPLTGLAKGQWKVIINWITEGKSYLNEQEVIIK